MNNLVFCVLLIFLCIVFFYDLISIVNKGEKIFSFLLIDEYWKNCTFFGKFACILFMLLFIVPDFFFVTIIFLFKIFFALLARIFFKDICILERIKDALNYDIEIKVEYLINNDLNSISFYPKWEYMNICELTKNDKISLNYSFIIFKCTKKIDYETAIEIINKKKQKIKQ